MPTPARLHEALALPVAAVGVGQVGCLTKLPGDDDLRSAADAVRASGRAFVLVAPVAWPETADEVVRRVRAVAAGGAVTVVANDLGTLIELARERPRDCRLVVGTGLTRQRPPAGDPSAAGAPPARLDVALLEVLHGYGVDDVEVDAETLLPDDAGADAAGEAGGDPDGDAGGDDARGRRIRQLVDVVPVGIGRSCPVARLSGHGPPGCESSCDRPLVLTANRRWRLVHGHRETLPARSRPAPLTVWGNVVVRRTTAAATAAYRIVDVRGLEPEQLVAAVLAQDPLAGQPVRNALG